MVGVLRLKTTDSKKRWIYGSKKFFIPAVEIKGMNVE